MSTDIGYDARSGLHVAQAAHDAGAVVEAPHEPLHDVTVAFTVHGPADLSARIVEELTEHLTILAGVSSLTISTVEREPA